MIRAGNNRSRRIVAVVAVLLALAFLVVAVIVVAPWKANAYSAATFCPHDGNYPRTAVLIDATDSLSESQIKTVLDNINSLRQKDPDTGREPLEIYEWVGIFVLNEDNLTLPKPTVALCYPGSEDTANLLYQNPRRIQDRYEKQFLRPLEETAKRLAGAPEQSSSPIFEMIRAVALVKSFDSTKKRRLVIASDMLQNVAEYSHYGNAPDYAKWRETEYAQKFLEPSLLRGVTVEIWYLKRPGETGDLQTRGHVDFWEQYFNDVGAEVAALRPI